MDIDFDGYLLAALILLAALLYSSVGHAGASGYLAVMALFGVSPATMKPTALTLNILVAIIATIKFYRAGAFSWPIFWPLAIMSIPCAFIGGLITLPAALYKPLVGIVLVYAAWRAYYIAAEKTPAPCTPPSRPVLVGVGAGLGFLSGLTGVGGGIFLSPILLLCRWAETKTVSGTSAAFILVNSIAGFAGIVATSATLPTPIPLWALAAVVGGFIGAELGSRRLANPTIRRLLALVLLIAGVKMIFAV
jgi:uncharacterized membrane protein YfcA